MCVMKRRIVKGDITACFVLLCVNVPSYCRLRRVISTSSSMQTSACDPVSSELSLVDPSTVYQTLIVAYGLSDAAMAMLRWLTPYSVVFSPSSTLLLGRSLGSSHRYSYQLSLATCTRANPV